MAMTFQRATRHQAKLRLALLGPSGSGKTYTALLLARGLVGPEGRIALIDTERGSASKYADLTDFDALQLATFEPEQYVSAIEAAMAAGYGCLIIDSLSHAWAGKGGILEFVDDAKRRQKNDFGAWRDATPKHNKLVDAILAAPVHIIATMRTKTAYEIVERNGKKVPQKIGLQPIQRDGMEYEFDVVADLDLDHVLVPSKTRLSFLSGKVYHDPGTDLGDTIRAWCDGGEPTPATAPEPPADPDAELVVKLRAAVAPLAARLNARDKDKDAAKKLAHALTGKASSDKYELADWQRVLDGFTLELDGDGEPDADTGTLLAEGQ